MFMVGREHANAFSELTDPVDQVRLYDVKIGDLHSGIDVDYLPTYLPT